MVPVRILVQWSGQSEETHENVAYFNPTISQSMEEREEGIKMTSIVPPRVYLVLYGLIWCGYSMIWQSMVPPNNHTSRLINHYSCHLAKLIHRIQNPCDDQFNPKTFNCLLLWEEEPDHYCHRFSSFSKLHKSWNTEKPSISWVLWFSLLCFGWDFII